MMKSFWYSSKTEAGFTLIEMIVALAIVVIIMSVIVIDYSTSRFKLALSRSAQKLSLDLHRVETDSLTTREFKSSGVPYGWGIHFYGVDSTNYTIFADLDNNKARAGGGAEDLATFNFESGVKVLSANITDVVFIPPDPDVIFTPSGPTASIVLTTIKGGTRTITINKFGAITTQ